MRSPWKLFFLSALFVSIGVCLAIYVPSIAGGPVVLAMIPSIPLVWSLLVREEHRDEDEKLLDMRSFDYHAPLLRVFTYFFLGATLAYAFWFAVLPASQASSLFGAQISEISVIRSTSDATGHAISPDFAASLFSHNLVVLAFMFAFCLIYGIGSLYLLLWNASIIGVFIGSKFASGPPMVVASFLGIVPHGIFEIGAYFVASIAGGMLSAAIMRRHYKHRQFSFIVEHIAILTIAAIVLLGIGAILESMA